MDEIKEGGRCESFKRDGSYVTSFLSRLSANKAKERVAAVHFGREACAEPAPDLGGNGTAEQQGEATLPYCLIRMTS